MLSIFGTPVSVHLRVATWLTLVMMRAEKGVNMIREVQIAKAIEKGDFHEQVNDGSGEPYLDWVHSSPFPRVKRKAPTSKTSYKKAKV